MYLETFFFPWNTKEVIYSRSVLSHNESEWGRSFQARYKAIIWLQKTWDMVQYTLPTFIVNFCLFWCLKNIWLLFSFLKYTSGKEEWKLCRYMFGLTWGTIPLRLQYMLCVVSTLLPNLHSSLHTRQMSNSCHTCSRPCWTVGSKQPNPSSWKNSCLLRAPIAMTLKKMIIKFEFVP